MSPDAISPLRQRMLEYTTTRQFVAQTQRDYMRQVRKIMAFLGTAFPGLPLDRHRAGGFAALPASPSRATMARDPGCRATQTSPRRNT